MSATMHGLTCTDCGRPVAYGDAVMRSRMFVPVAFHRECFARIRSDLPPIPAHSEKSAA
jgi:hypothetical protein